MYEMKCEQDTTSVTSAPSSSPSTPISMAPSVFPTSNSPLEEQCPTNHQLNILKTGNSLEGEAAGDWFGRSVSIAGDGRTLAIGSFFNDGNGSNSGHVRIFNLNSQNEWTQMGEDIDGLNRGEFFGWSVSLSSTGNRLAVSSLYNSNENGSAAGCARVFDFKENKWIKIGSDILGLAAGDNLRLVALSGDGNTLAVSMPNNDDNAYSAGKVQVFAFIDEEWTWTKVGDNHIMTGSNSRDYFGDFGLAISTDGTTVAAGSYSKEYVKVFVLVDGGWRLVGNVINGGYSVDLSESGRRIVIGSKTKSYGGLTRRGRVLVFDYDNDGKNWVMVGKPLYGENSSDYFGESVSISDSGSRLAVGGYGNDQNGNDAGHVRVFDFEEGNSEWIQIDKDIDGKSDNDYFGWSVALSHDAKFVAVGAYGRNSSTGAAEVYEMKCQSKD